MGRRTTKGMFAARKTEATPPSDLQASLVQDRLESKSFCYQSPFPFCAPYCTNIKRWPSLRRSQKRALLKARWSLRWMWRNNCSPLMQRQTQCPLQVSHDDESNHHIIPSSVFHCLLSSFCHLSVFFLRPYLTVVFLLSSFCLLSSLLGHPSSVFLLSSFYVPSVFCLPLVLLLPSFLPFIFTSDSSALDEMSSHRNNISYGAKQ